MESPLLWSDGELEGLLQGGVDSGKGLGFAFLSTWPHGGKELGLHG